MRKINEKLFDLIMAYANETGDWTHVINTMCQVSKAIHMKGFHLYGRPFSKSANSRWFLPSFAYSMISKVMEMFVGEAAYIVAGGFVKWEDPFGPLLDTWSIGFLPYGIVGNTEYEGDNGIIKYHLIHKFTHFDRMVYRYEKAHVTKGERGDF
jgi:hypothetical protein